MKIYSATIVAGNKQENLSADSEDGLIFKIGKRLQDIRYKKIVWWTPFSIAVAWWCFLAWLYFDAGLINGIIALCAAIALISVPFAYLVMRPFLRIEVAWEMSRKFKIGWSVKECDQDAFLAWRDNDSNDWDG